MKIVPSQLDYGSFKLNYKTTNFSASLNFQESIKVCKLFNCLDKFLIYFPKDQSDYILKYSRECDTDIKFTKSTIQLLKFMEVIYEIN